MSVRVPPSEPLLGAVLGPFWVVWEASWAVLGLSGTILGPSRGPIEPSWGDGASWAGLERRATD
eukprot:7255906-Pyramimonas_sp.AAC.1